MVKYINILLIGFFICVALFPNVVRAQDDQTQVPPEEKFKAVIKQVQEVKENVAEKGQTVQKVILEATSGQRKGDEISVVVSPLTSANPIKYKEGDRVIVSMTIDFEGQEKFYITDFERSNVLLWLFIIFIVFVVGIGFIKGLTSLLGLAISFLVIFKFLLPQIIAGRDPVLIAIASAIIIVPVTFVFSHGFNRKTISALLATIIALFITGLLAIFFVEAARLTGFASEEAHFLQTAQPDITNMKGLVLAGIIIGVLGVLDDVTISQAAAVEQLKSVSPDIKFKDLFSKAMRVGRDHSAAMINTLILVYTGASLPLLLLFTNYDQSLEQVVNLEFIAEEVIRTLVGSIGLILAVPITTIIATFLFQAAKVNEK